jgi:hypothetical protein
MQNHLRRFLLAAVMLICLASSGCAPSLRLGPETKTEYVLVKAGRPIVILKNTTVTGRVLDGTGQEVQQDVGGWIMMPPDHWDAVQRALETVAERATKQHYGL